MDYKTGKRRAEDESWEQWDTHLLKMFMEQNQSAHEQHLEIMSGNENRFSTFCC